MQLTAVITVHRDNIYFNYASISFPLITTKSYEHHGVSHHLNGLFVLALYEATLSVNDGYPSQFSNLENVSMAWFPMITWHDDCDPVDDQFITMTS